MNTALRILVVEDHLDSQQVMVRLLQALGHQTGVAGNVAQTLELAGRGHFDMVIADLSLPDGSGMSLMSELRNRFGLPGIAMSGYDDDREPGQSRSAGFAAHLTKPIAVDKLVEAIQQLKGVGSLFDRYGPWLATLSVRNVSRAIRPPSTSTPPPPASRAWPAVTCCVR